LTQVRRARPAPPCFRKYFDAPPTTTEPTASTAAAATAATHPTEPPTTGMIFKKRGAYHM
jgi:hypothetical protein